MVPLLCERPYRREGLGSEHRKESVIFKCSRRYVEAVGWGQIIVESSPPPNAGPSDGASVNLLKHTLAGVHLHGEGWPSGQE